MWRTVNSLQLFSTLFSFQCQQNGVRTVVPEEISPRLVLELGIGLGLGQTS